MKLKYTLIIILTICYTTAKAQYSTTNKKAIQTFEQAMSKYSANDFAEADLLADKALKTEPKFVEAHWLKADIAHATKNYDSEITHLKNALKLKPNDENTILGIADAYFINYNNDSALVYYNILRNMSQLSEKTRNHISTNIANAQFRTNALANPLNITLKPLGPNVNTIYNDYFPSLSADSRTLVYTIELPQTKQNPMLPNTQEDIYITQRATPDSPWQQAKSIGGAVNTSNNEGAPYITADGSMLLFTSCTCPDGLIRCCDIYYIELENSQWGFPKKMASPVNSEYWESQPCLSSDYSTLYFVSNRPGGYGGKDIWYCTRNNNGTWNGPYNLGPEVNTPGDETSPFIHSDNKTLYFCTNARIGMGGQDIYVTRNINGHWTEPQNLGYPINTRYDETRLAIPVLGETAIIASNREIEGQSKSIDLYEIQLPKSIRPNRTIFVEGSVYDKTDKKPIASQFQLVNLQNNDTVLTGTTLPKYINILLYLPQGFDYALNVSADGYMMNSKHFSLRNLNDSIEKIQLEIPLEKIKIGSTIVLNNIFFDTDQHTLKPESNYELSKLVTFLNNNPKIKIEIGGHTDNVGTETHNKQLSQNRANTIVNYLISKGISPNRLSSKGYGSTKPAAPNDTPENRAKNRRTEITVQEF